MHLVCLPNLSKSGPLHSCIRYSYSDSNFSLDTVTGAHILIALCKHNNNHQNPFNVGVVSDGQDGVTTGLS